MITFNINLANDDDLYKQTLDLRGGYSIFRTLLQADIQKYGLHSKCYSLAVKIDKTLFLIVLIVFLFKYKQLYKLFPNEHQIRIQSGLEQNNLDQYIYNFQFCNTTYLTRSARVLNNQRPFFSIDINSRKVSFTSLPRNAGIPRLRLKQLVTSDLAKFAFFLVNLARDIQRREGTRTTIPKESCRNPTAHSPTMPKFHYKNSLKQLRTSENTSVAKFISYKISKRQRQNT